MLPSNWSLGHLPNSNEDVEVHNPNASLLSLIFPNGSTMECQSLKLSGNLSFTNYGTIIIKRSNGNALHIDNVTSLTNSGSINISKACGKPVNLKGNFTNKASLVIEK